MFKIILIVVVVIFILSVIATVVENSYNIDRLMAREIEREREKYWISLRDIEIESCCKRQRDFQNLKTKLLELKELKERAEDTDNIILKDLVKIREKEIFEMVNGKGGKDNE